MLEEARRDAELTKGKIVAEARQAAGDERHRAVREIELAKNAAVQDLAVTSAQPGDRLGAQGRERPAYGPTTKRGLSKEALSSWP